MTTRFTVVSKCGNIARCVEAKNKTEALAKAGVSKDGFRVLPGWTI